MKYKTLDALIRDTESIIGVPPGNLYVRLSRIALSCMQSLELHVIPNVKSTKITISSSGTANIPDDVVEVIKVGVLGSDRRIIPLARMPRLYAPDEFQTYCCNEKAIDTVTVQSDPLVYHNYSWDNDFVGEYYGWTQDPFPQGGYYHDEKNNRLIFTPNGWAVTPGDDLIIEYQSSMNQAEAKIVPVEAEMMLRYYILKEFFLTSSPNQSEYYRKLLRGAMKDYNDLKTEYSLKQVLETLRGTSQAAKYE